MNDRIAASAEVRAATDRFVAECARATDSQWLFRPSPEDWSMAQVTEHVAISTRNIVQMLTRRLLDSQIGGRATDVIDAEIPYLSQVTGGVRGRNMVASPDVTDQPNRLGA